MTWNSLYRIRKLSYRAVITFAVLLPITLNIGQATTYAISQDSINSASAVRLFMIQMNHGVLVRLVQAALVRLL